MLWAALSFASGIVTGVYAWRPPIWWLAAWIVFAFSATYLLRRRGRAAFSLGLGVLFVLGAFIVQVCGPDTSGDSGLLKFADGSEVVVTAHVTNEESPQAESSGDVRQRLDLETEQITRRNERFEVRCGLRLSIYDELPRRQDGRETAGAATRLFHYGERLRFPAKLSAPRNFRNPGAFDYRSYLRENGGSPHWPPRSQRISKFFLESQAAG